jgi:hypothetical protein
MQEQAEHVVVRTELDQLGADQRAGGEVERLLRPTGEQVGEVEASEVGDWQRHGPGRPDALPGLAGRTGAVPGAEPGVERGAERVVTCHHVTQCATQRGRVERAT